MLHLRKRQGNILPFCLRKKDVQAFEPTTPISAPSEETSTEPPAESAIKAVMESIAEPVVLSANESVEVEKGPELVR